MPVPSRGALIHDAILVVLAFGVAWYLAGHWQSLLSLFPVVEP